MANNIKGVSYKADFYRGLSFHETRKLLGEALVEGYFKFDTTNSLGNNKTIAFTEKVGMDKAIAICEKIGTMLIKNEIRLKMLPGRNAFEQDVLVVKTKYYQEFEYEDYYFKAAYLQEGYGSNSYSWYVVLHD